MMGPRRVRPRGTGPARGSGLVGLADRVEALSGSIRTRGEGTGASVSMPSLGAAGGEAVPGRALARRSTIPVDLDVTSETSMCDACACFTTLARASDTTKYAATSIGSGKRMFVAQAHRRQSRQSWIELSVVHWRSSGRPGLQLPWGERPRNRVATKRVVSAGAL